MPAGDNAVKGRQGFQTARRPAAELPDLDIGAHDDSANGTAALRERFAALGLPDDALDDDVIDLASRSASAAVNEHGADFDDAHDAAERSASEINNGGPQAQIAYLVAELGEDGARQAIDRAADRPVTVQVDTAAAAEGTGWTAVPGTTPPAFSSRHGRVEIDFNDGRASLHEASDEDTDTPEIASLPYDQRDPAAGTRAAHQLLLLGAGALPRAGRPTAN